MSFLWSGIPHLATDGQVRSFFTVLLGVEFIDDIDKAKPSGSTLRTPYAAHLREALEYLLRERPCDVVEWSTLTGVAFEDDTRLYAYLQELYDHFYGGRKEPPAAPDPEAPVPDWVRERWP
ncbi:hypothetical protein [Kitasatospora sp. NPDC088346]|uniref:hypothetical protein n=1 Tax=Kitasatospora sp. NPDC088346 TaxID=3364073 RepID=UPI00382E5B04